VKWFVILSLVQFINAIANSVDITSLSLSTVVKNEIPPYL